jgi:hypothetical protein
VWLECERLRQGLGDERAAAARLGDERDESRRQLAAAQADCHRLGAEAGRAAAECDQFRAEASRAAAECVQLRAEAGRTAAECERLRGQLADVAASLPLRLRAWALKVPLLAQSVLRRGRAWWRGRRRATAPVPPAPFIVGVARSGTTLLRLMLDAHPLLAIPAETGFLPAVAALAGPTDDPRRDFLDAITALPTWEDLALSRDDLRARLAEVEPFTPADGVRCLFRTYARRLGKWRWGDKTPVHGLHLRAIHALLPEARFLHILRDGRDVALSLRGLWFAPGDTVEAMARHWRERVEAIRAEGAGCPHYLEIRYEDLLRRTRPLLRRICRFLELPFSPAMEAYHEGAAARLDEVTTRYRADGSVLITKEQRLHLHRRTGQRPDPSRCGRWRTEMTPEERRAFEQIAGDLLRQLGYETSEG